MQMQTLLRKRKVQFEYLNYKTCKSNSHFFPYLQYSPVHTLHYNKIGNKKEV